VPFIIARCRVYLIHRQRSPTPDSDSPTKVYISLPPSGLFSGIGQDAAGLRGEERALEHGRGPAPSTLWAGNVDAQ